MLLYGSTIWKVTSAVTPNFGNICLRGIIRVCFDDEIAQLLAANRAFLSLSKLVRSKSHRRVKDPSVQDSDLTSYIYYSETWFFSKKKMRRM